MKIKRVDFSKKFEKDLRKAPKKVQIAARTRIEIFLLDKFNPILNNHALTGKYEGYRSINITGDWRAVFRELEVGEIVYFDVMGTHSQLYRKTN
jgi:addiction module RelE/StbE family toxin